MSLFRRIANLFVRSSIDREIEAELRSHIEMRTADNLASGMSRQEARRDAAMRFGNLISTKENVTGMDVALAIEGFWADLRYACRQLRRNPGFAGIAIAVLTLGICTSVAIFAFVDAVLITPLPYANPSQLMGLYESNPLGPRFHLSYLDYLDWKRMNKSFRSIEAYDNKAFAMRTASGLERTDGAIVSAGFFSTLGVSPILGRDFRPSEDQPGAANVTLLSYAAWRNRYGGSPDVLGKTVDLDGQAFTIIAVLPKEFYFAQAGPAEFWTALHASTDPDSRGGHWLSAIGRLNDGVSPSTASAEMSRIAALLAKQYPDSDNGRGATVVPLTEVVTGNLRPILLLLMCGAILLLLIAGVNVSSLLLVRSENRRREIAVRGALGASRGRLIRQFVTEGLALALTGALLGAGAAYGAIHLLTRLVPANMLAAMPYLKGLGLNPHVLAFALAITIVIGALFSLTPVFRLKLDNVRDGLAGGGRTAAGTVWRHLGANLVVVELCIAMVLLSGAGLLGRSFYRLIHVGVGMETDHLAMLQLRTPQSPAYAKDAQIAALARRVVDEVKGLPGVQSVAIAQRAPLAGAQGGSTTFQIVGRPSHGLANEANDRVVSAGYFSTVRAQLVHGRFFTGADDATRPRVMIVNRSFAQKYFPGEDALGKQIGYNASELAAGSPVEIVGVIDNIKEGPLDAEVAPTLYIPFEQGPDGTFNVVVRTAESPKAFLKTLEGTIRAIDSGFLIYGSETMEDRISESQSAYLHRSSAWLVGGFAALALLLGVVGLYGVIAYSVSQRTREIGVRMALGAQRGSVYQLVMSEAGRLVAVGVGAGLVCSVGAATLMRSMLFGTPPWDALTLSAVAVVLAASATLASYIPARRAASVNPVEALRAE